MNFIYLENDTMVASDNGPDVPDDFHVQWT